MLDDMERGSAPRLNKPLYAFACIYTHKYTLNVPRFTGGHRGGPGGCAGRAELQLETRCPQVRKCPVDTRGRLRALGRVCQERAILAHDVTRRHIPILALRLPRGPGERVGRLTEVYREPPHSQVGGRWGAGGLRRGVHGDLAHLVLCSLFLLP